MFGSPDSLGFLDAILTPHKRQELTAFRSNATDCVHALGARGSLAIRRPTVGHVAVAMFGVVLISAALSALATEQETAQPELLNREGVLLLRQGNLQRAAEKFRAAIRLRPTYTEAHLNLGQVFLDMKALDKAVEEF